MSIRFLYMVGMFGYLFPEQQEKILATDQRKQKTPEEQIKTIADIYLDKLYRYVRYTFSVPETVAQDIVQEFFLVLPKKRAKIDQSKSGENFLYRIMHNFAIDMLRKYNKTTTYETQLGDEETFVHNVSVYSETNDLPIHIEHKYKSTLLQVALGKMKQQYRELLTLFYIEEKNYEEISEITGIGKSSIGTYIARAKAELKQIVSTDSLLQDAITFDL